MPDWLRQIEELLRYHLPTDEFAIPPGSIAMSLLAGLVLSLFGARLVRFCLGIIFMGGGGVIGGYFARQYGYSPLPGILIGAVLLGVIGYFLFRMWVSALAGVLLAVIAAGVVAMPEMPALVQQFEQSRTGGATSDYLLPAANQQEEEKPLLLSQYCIECGQFIQARRPELVRNTAIVSALAFLLGSAIGLFAYQWAMILGTTITGAALLISGLAPLANRYWPQAIEWIHGNPKPAMGILAGWMLLAILSQYRGVRKTVQVVKVAAAEKDDDRHR